MGGFTIRDLADEFGLTLRTLRFYEQRGLLTPVRDRKNLNAVRIYDQNDREKLAEIIRLTKMGFTIAEISRGNFSDAQYRQQLARCLNRIAELETAVSLIRARISGSSAESQQAQTHCISSETQAKCL